MFTRFVVIMFVIISLFTTTVTVHAQASTDEIVALQKQEANLGRAMSSSELHEYLSAHILGRISKSKGVVIPFHDGGNANEAFTQLKSMRIFGLELKSGISKKDHREIHILSVWMNP